MSSRNIVGRTWPNDCNIKQHPQMLHEKFDHFQAPAKRLQHIAALLGATCCVRLANLLRRGCCWLKFETGQIFHQTFVYAACCSRLARFVQQCCAWACALVRFSTRNMSQHVATGWPNACNMLRPTMLRSVAFKCCDRLAGTCKCCASNGGI